MARSWHEVFKGVDESSGDAAGVTARTQEEEKKGFFGRLKAGMSKSRKSMQQHLSVVMFDRLDAEQIGRASCRERV